jgi:putative flippase GtrA
VCLRLFNLAPGTANAISYALTLCVSFVLNRHYVFNAAPFAKQAVWRFALAFAIAFSVNQALLRGLLHRAWLSPEIAQLFSMGAYTVVFYLLSKFFVFRGRNAKRASKVP